MDSFRVTVTPYDLEFLAAKLDYGSFSRKRTGLYYLIDRRIKTGFNYDVGRNDRFRLSICDNSRFLRENPLSCATSSGE